MTRDELLHLVERAERGALLPAEADLLREGFAAVQHTGGTVPAFPGQTAETELAERLTTAAQLAAALGDHPHDDAWHLADAIRRLCTDEITPAQALDDTDRRTTDRSIP